MRYTESHGDHVLRIGPARGTFAGQVADREWTVVFTDATAPATVRIDGVAVPPARWSFDPDRRTLTVTVPARSVRTATTVDYR